VWAEDFDLTPSWGINKTKETGKWQTILAEMTRGGEISQLVIIPDKQICRPSGVDNVEIYGGNASAIDNK